MNYAEKRKNWTAKNMSIISAEVEITRKENAIKTQERHQNEDTQTRKEIQKYILDNYAKGRSKEEILKRLNFVFGKPKYQKYRPYFETWVENVVGKETSKGEERE